MLKVPTFQPWRLTEIVVAHLQIDRLPSHKTSSTILADVLQTARARRMMGKPTGSVFTLVSSFGEFEDQNLARFRQRAAMPLCVCWAAEHAVSPCVCVCTYGLYVHVNYAFGVFVS